jgi:hypothetical protein
LSRSGTVVWTSEPPCDASDSSVQGIVTWNWTSLIIRVSGGKRPKQLLLRLRLACKRPGDFEFAERRSSRRGREIVLASLRRANETSGGCRPRSAFTLPVPVLAKRWIAPTILKAIPRSKSLRSACARVDRTTRLITRVPGNSSLPPS